MNTCFQLFSITPLPFPPSSNSFIPYTLFTSLPLSFLPFLPPSLPSSLLPLTLPHSLLPTLPLTPIDKSAVIPPLPNSCMSSAVMIPSLVNPTRYRPRNGCRPPELIMSSFRSNMILTGCFTLRKNAWSDDRVGGREEGEMRRKGNN